MLTIKKINIIIISFTFILVPLIYDQQLLNLFDLPQAIALNIATILLFVVFILKQKKFDITALTLTISFYIIFNFLSLIWTSSIFLSLEQIIQRFLAYSVFILISYSGKKIKKNIIYSFIILSFIVSIIGISQALFKLILIPQAMPPSVTFGNRNTASQITSILLTFNLIALFNSRKKVYAVIFSVSSLLSIFFIYLTKTRSSWLGLFLAFIFLNIYIILKLKEQNSSYIFKRFMIIIPVIIITLSSILLIEVKGFSINKELLNSGTFNTRITLWRNSMEMAKDKVILGVGPNNFQVFYPYYHTRGRKDSTFSERMQPVNTHNEFIQHFSELGIIGGVLFIAIIVITGAYLIRLYKDYNHTKNKLFFISLTGVIIIFFIIFNLSFFYSRQTGLLIYYSILGIINNYYLNKRKKKKFPHKSIQTIFSGGILIGLVISLFYLGSVYKSDKLMKNIYTISANGRILETIETGNRIININSFRKDINIILGWAYLELGNIEKAEELFNEVLKSQPYHIYTLKKLAQIYSNRDIHKYNDMIRTLYRIDPLEIELKTF